MWNVHREKEKSKKKRTCGIRCLFLADTCQSSHSHLFSTQSIRKLPKAHPSSAKCFREEKIKPGSRPSPCRKTELEKGRKKKNKKRNNPPVVSSPSPPPVQGPQPPKSSGVAAEHPEPGLQPSVFLGSAGTNHVNESCDVIVSIRC